MISANGSKGTMFTTCLPHVMVSLLSSVQVQWNLHIPDTIGTLATFPDYRDVLNSELPLYRLVAFGTRKSVHIIEVSTVGGSTVLLNAASTLYSTLASTVNNLHE